MEQINIYPNRERTFQKELELLLKYKISQHNKKLITEFQNYLFAHDSRDLRVSKLSSQLRRISKWIIKDLDKVNEKDIQTLIAKINQMNKYSDATKSDYKRCIKQFYRWHKSNDKRLESDSIKEYREGLKFYEMIEKIKINYKTKNIRFDDIITDEEIKKVLKTGFYGESFSQRDKAFIALLHETGMRAGEILTMRIKSIVRESKYAKITIDGKTGVRSIIIVSSVPYLFKWLEVHPFNGNPMAPLWVGQSRRYGKTPLTERGAYSIVHKAFDIAKVFKKHNLHWFRHSRATILSEYLKEVQLCKYMGWAIGSRQVKTYCHASDKQTESSILKIHGIEELKQKKQVNTPKDCPICNEINTGIAEYCSKCGTPLSLKSAINHEERVKSEADDVMNKFMELVANNPGKMQEFIRYKQNMKDR